MSVQWPFMAYPRRIGDVRHPVLITTTPAFGRMDVTLWPRPSKAPAAPRTDAAQDPDPSGAPHRPDASHSGPSGRALLPCCSMMIDVDASTPPPATCAYGRAQRSPGAELS
jgi:hypothetical protein